MLVGITIQTSRISRCNTTLLKEPECTRESLTDAQLMKTSGYLHVDSTDIRCSGHYVV